MDELQTIAEEMKNDNYKYLKNGMPSLKTLIPEPAVIKEKDFKTYFLPIIDGSVEINEENMDRFRHNLLKLTESYRLPFSVYTDDMEKLIFTLPPLVLDIDKNGIVSEVNFARLGNMYREMSNSNNLQADSFLSSSFKGLKEILKPDENEVNFYDNEVKKIYERYNLKSSSDRKSEDTVTEISKPKNTKNKLYDEEYDDIFDYE